ncbi:hypothetical protein [Pseudomonas sp. TCU-HL1]|uniref:hypothetical protein n=1 Tax=Pseudomonas sp. TCU-HL1 TaxID=1856685 RepID=UPI00083DC10D|nr:hypothetical protein [Pseudomonas sp. TCU-HL1]AOE87035.1 hypothetical protein THL1_4487 [Pseudomonas sp. TCU-HL1]
MGSAKDTLIHLHERVPQRALEGLNRVTGLNFRHWPESLVQEERRKECGEAEVPTVESGRVMPG